MTSGARPGGDFPIDLETELAAFIAKGGLGKFPTPSAAIRAGSIMWDVNYKTDELAKTIGKDSELVAEFLRRANSAALARAGGCTSIANAINRLGAEQTAFLLIAHRYGEQIAIDGPLLPLRARIWREGLAGARLCESLAKARRLAGHEAFLCGLNHDIGRAITCACLEMILLGRRSLPAMPEAFWTDFVDRHHVAVGSSIAEMWQMPPAIREIIAAHHRTSAEGVSRADLLDLVRIADAINQALAECSHLSIDRLAAIPGVQEGEVSVVAQVIEELPQFIADMERRSKKPLWGLVPLRPLIRHEGPDVPGARALAVSVSCASGGKRNRYESQWIAPERMLIVGDVPLRERFLTEVSIETEPEVRIWAEVVSCEKHERAHQLALRPFALGARELAGWTRLAGVPIGSS